MADESTIQLPLSDFETIQAALTSAYNQSIVMDLVDSYRKLSNRKQDSPMTKSLGSALDLMTSYLPEPEEEPSE